MRRLLVLPVLFALAACSPITRTHGNMVDEESLKQVNVGVSRQADVVALLGTPSAEGTFDPNEWFYIGQITEKTAFFQPEVVKREVIRITFDSSTGTVSHVDQLDQNSGQYVDIVERTTPTAGHNLSVIEQVIGNVGRFSAPKKNN